MRLTTIAEIDDTLDSAVILVDDIVIDEMRLSAQTLIHVQRLAPGKMKMCVVLTGEHRKKAVTLPGPVRVLV